MTAEKMAREYLDREGYHDIECLQCGNNERTEASRVFLAGYLAGQQSSHDKLLDSIGAWMSQLEGSEVSMTAIKELLRSLIRNESITLPATKEGAE